MPAGGFLKYRSNVPEYAKYVFNCFNKKGQPTFAERALKLRETNRNAVIIAGESYGQGSSREHAALCPMYLGVKLVIAKSIERIHHANLINFAIVAATFENTADYERVKCTDTLEVDNLRDAIARANTFTVKDTTAKFDFVCRLNITERERQILLAGGKLNHTATQKVNGCPRRRP